MRLAQIDRRLLVGAAVIVVPLELIALLGFFSCPIDVGYPPGTSSWWIAFGVVGVCVHYPMGIVLRVFPMGPGLFRDLVCFTVGYADLFLLVLILAYVSRFIKRVVFSELCL